MENMEAKYAGLKAFSALGESDLELGFVLRQEKWGRGYATEIGRAHHSAYERPNLGTWHIYVRQRAA